VVLRLVTPVSNGAEIIAAQRSAILRDGSRRAYSRPRTRFEWRQGPIWFQCV